VPIVACAIDAVSLSQRIEQMRPNLAVLERVGAMPGQGVSSMFKFGQAFGTVQGILAALKVPTHLVAPVTWKRHFRLPADKELSRGLACGPGRRRIDLAEKRIMAGRSEPVGAFLIDARPDRQAP